MRYHSVAILLGMLCLSLGCEPLESEDRSISPADPTAESSPAPEGTSPSGEVDSIPATPIVGGQAPAKAPPQQPVATPAKDESNAWKDVKQVEADLTGLFDATVSGDVDKLIFYAHPTKIAGAGGEANAKKHIQAMLNQVKQANMAFSKLSFAGEPEFLESEKSYYVVVPTKVVVRIAGTPLEMTTYQFGQKSKAGGQWKYLEGAEINGDNVHDRFPDFPQGFKFPENAMLP